MSATTTPAAPTTKPRAKSAAKPKAKPAKPKPAPKEPRFPADISAAVKMARTTMHNARNPEKRAAASSAGDHVAVRAVIARLVGDKPTPDDVLRATGLTLPRLRAVAEFQTGTDDDLKVLRESALGKDCAKFETNRSWRVGRYLSGIVAAYVIQLREAAKS